VHWAAYQFELMTGCVCPSSQLSISWNIWAHLCQI